MVFGSIQTLWQCVSYALHWGKEKKNSIKGFEKPTDRSFFTVPSFRKWLTPLSSPLAVWSYESCRWIRIWCCLCAFTFKTMLMWNGSQLFVCRSPKAMPHDRLSRRQQKKKKKINSYHTHNFISNRDTIVWACLAIREPCCARCVHELSLLSVFFSSNVVMIVSTSTIVITEACQGEISQLFM